MVKDLLDNDDVLCTNLAISSMLSSKIPWSIKYLIPLTKTK